MNQHPWKIGDEASIEHTIQEEDLEKFVNLCGDDNPLHMDQAWAQKSLAGARVVHGMISASFISTLIGTKLPGPGALWNRFSIDWRQMLHIGDSIQIKAKVSHVSDNMLDLEIEGRRGKELILESKARVLLMSTPEQTKPALKSENKTVTTAQVSDQPKANPTTGGDFTLVTGASGGIGQSFIKAWSQSGNKSNLVLWGRNAQKLIKTLKEHHLNPDDHLTQEVDLANSDSIKTALANWPQNGACQGIVHIAASPYRTIAADSEEVLEETRCHLKIGLESFIQICTTLRPYMKSGSSIAALSTQFALGSPPENSAAYISTKLAIEGYIRSLAVELGQHNIRANLVSPSMINTPYNQEVPVRKKMVEEAKNPMRKLCTPEEVADTLLWLLSDKSSFVNGVNLPLTGGLAI